jgi:predicted O-methyltransferase YrrM
VATDIEFAVRHFDFCSGTGQGETERDLSEVKLYEYYAQEGFSPTFAGLADEAALDRYVAERMRALTDKLQIPPKIFAGARVLEFGPDTGENALVFARWGARLTLVEPNVKAHQQIRNYFRIFGFEKNIESLVAADVESFAAQDSFDFVIAEGFIYTIQPSTRWMTVFARLLTPEGLAVVSYYERRGGFLELFLKGILTAHRRITGLEPMASARALYQAKWDSIPHTRSFESWVRDVLINPFVRLSTFIDAGELLDQAAATGFSLYSAWPIYRQPLRPYWLKKILSSGEELRHDKAHLRKSDASFFLGNMAYCTDADGSLGKVVSTATDMALCSIDAAIEAADPTPSLSRCAEALKEVSTAISNSAIMTESEESREELLSLLQSLRVILNLAARGKVDDLEKRCREDLVFIAAWGMPNHYVVLRRR